MRYENTFLLMYNDYTKSMQGMYYRMIMEWEHVPNLAPSASRRMMKQNVFSRHLPKRTPPFFRNTTNKTRVHRFWFDFWGGMLCGIILHIKIPPLYTILW